MTPRLSTGTKLAAALAMAFLLAETANPAEGQAKPGVAATQGAAVLTLAFAIGDAVQRFAGRLASPGSWEEHSRRTLASPARPDVRGGAQTF